jgi:hypothetical protein
MFGVLFGVVRFALANPRGRRLLFLGVLSMARLARSSRARTAYERAWMNVVQRVRRRKR